MNVFRYPGGKSKKAVRQTIQQYFPPTFKQYREPFVGGGGMFWSMPTNIPRWINDLNTDVVAVYEALGSRPDQFIAMCESIPPFSPGEAMITKANGTQYPRRLSETFDRLLHDDDADPALRYLFLNRCAWNGRVRLAESNRNRTYFSNPKGWSKTFFETLESAAKIMTNVKLTTVDFEVVFDAPGDDVLIFADPPYVVDTEFSNSSKLYDCGFTMADHHRLRECVRRCRHSVVMTYDDHPVVRDLYRDFHIREASWTYCGRVDRQKGHELIITNRAVDAVAARVAT